jgi:hypothetical protein
MLRRNPETGAWERREGDAWVPAHNVDEAGLDLALEDAFEPGQEVMVTEPAPVGTVVAEVETEVPGQDDWELPGLVSSDGSKGTKGQAGLRKRLQDRARGKRNGAGNGVAKRVEVGPRSARPVGPAVKEGTEARQVQRRVRGAADGVKPQRYVSKPPPGLLSSRPRWVQDLFEAHFRSEVTLQMRKENNRMKISRTDYAIGWLTLLDKLKEDPSIARLKEKGA